jgi:site-specific DNA-methyltransferase (adenine-specific)
VSHVEQIGQCTLYLGDCRDIIPEIGGVDAVVTDPPYGVGLGEITSAIGKTGYESFVDTRENVRRSIIPVIDSIRHIAGCVVLTPGSAAMMDYPEPDNIGCIYFPAGAGLNKWGFTCAQPILFYGADPYLRDGLGGRADSVMCSETSEKNGHPCPKPIKLMRWFVNRATTRQGQTVLDPFMGSGTTGVASVNLGRKFIGIEIEPKYFDIACKRIEEAYKQGDMFIERPKPLKQDAMI